MLYNILFFICTWLFWASYFYFTHKIKWEYSLFYHYLSFGCVVGLTSKIVELSFSFFLSFLLCMGICILCLFKCVYMSKYISVHVYVQVSSMGGCTCMYRSLGQILGICLHFYTTMFFEAGPYKQTWSLQNGNSQSFGDLLSPTSKTGVTGKSTYPTIIFMGSGDMNSGPLAWHKFSLWVDPSS